MPGVESASGARLYLLARRPATTGQLLDPLRALVDGAEEGDR